MTARLRGKPKDLSFEEYLASLLSTHSQIEIATKFFDPPVTRQRVQQIARYHGLFRSAAARDYLVSKLKHYARRNNSIKETAEHFGLSTAAAKMLLRDAAAGVVHKKSRHASAISKTLKKCGGNITRCAAALGISTTTVAKVARETGLAYGSKPHRADYVRQTALNLMDNRFKRAEIAGFVGVNIETLRLWRAKAKLAPYRNDRLDSEYIALHSLLDQAIATRTVKQTLKSLGIDPAVFAAWRERRKAH